MREKINTLTLNELKKFIHFCHNNDGGRIEVVDENEIAKKHKERRDKITTTSNTTSTTTTSLDNNAIIENNNRMLKKTIYLEKAKIFLNQEAFYKWCSFFFLSTNAFEKTIFECLKEINRGNSSPLQHDNTTLTIITQDNSGGGGGGSKRGWENLQSYVNIKKLKRKMGLEFYYHKAKQRKLQ